MTIAREATSLALHIIGLATLCRWAGGVWRYNAPYARRGLREWQSAAIDRAAARPTTRVWGSRP